MDRPVFRLAPFLGLSACSLSLVSVYNGYPLVYPDSGVYLAQAIEFIGEPSRPPYYSLFIFPFHMKVSLWPVVFIQGFIATIVIYWTLRSLRLTVTGPALTSLTVGLTFATSLPWFSGQVMPDVFTGLVILLAFVLAYGRETLTATELVLAEALFSGILTFHLTHVPLAVILTAGLLAVEWPRRAGPKTLWPALLRLSVPIFLAVNGFAVYTYAVTGRVGLSPDGPKFLLARVLYDGPGRKYLADNCPTLGFELCKYLEELPEEQGEFMWGPESPWAEVERAIGFNESRAQASRIISNTLRQYPAWQFRESLSNFVSQLGTFDTGDTQCPCMGYVRSVILKHFPSEYANYMQSKQTVGILPLSFIREYHRFVVYLSVAIVGVLLARRLVFGRPIARDGSPMVQFFVFVVVGMVSNAALTGVFSEVSDRYQSRVTWLLPFFVLVWIVSLRQRCATKGDGPRGTESHSCLVLPVFFTLRLWEHTSDGREFSTISE